MIQVNVAEKLKNNDIKILMLVLSQNPDIPKYRKFIDETLLNKVIVADHIEYIVNRVEYQSISNDLEHQFIGLIVDYPKVIDTGIEDEAKEEGIWNIN